MAEEDLPRDSAAGLVARLAPLLPGHATIVGRHQLQPNPPRRPVDPHCAEVVLVHEGPDPIRTRFVVGVGLTAAVAVRQRR